jgi:23S rRNA-intervening sequence protein
LPVYGKPPGAKRLSIKILPWPSWGLTHNIPACENFGLIDQIRGAAVAIPADIAAGQGRNATKEFRQCLGIRLGSQAFRLKWKNDQGLIDRHSMMMALAQTGEGFFLSENRKPKTENRSK